MLEVNVKIIKCTLKTYINQEKPYESMLIVQMYLKIVYNIYWADDELDFFCLNFVIFLAN